MKRFSALLTSVLVLLCTCVAIAQPAATAPAPAASAVAKPVTERWYVLLMQGKRAGWMKSTETVRDGKISSASEMRMEIKRGPIAIDVKMMTEFIETEGGKPVSMSSDQTLGAMATKSTTVFTDDATETTSIIGTQKNVTKGTLPKGEWLTPAAAERYVKAELAKGSKEIKVVTIDPSVGEGVLTVTRRVVENCEIEVFGRTVPAVKWESSIDKYPGVKQTEYVDAQGEVLKSVTNMGGIMLEQLAADKDLAMSKLDAPELLMSTTVKPDKPLHNPRQLSHATYRVSVEKDEMPDLPTVAGQTFTRESPKAGLIVQEAKGIEPVAAADLAAVRAKHLESSIMLKCDDPEIVALVKGAGIEGMPRAEAAEKLRRFVNQYIKTKDMSVGFASASEVARTRTGDCTEHAVLLAAMLRAADIPSRCASGLVYVDQFGGQEGIFGYHMWAQALLEQKDGTTAWVNVDATLPPNVPYDAAHILLSVSALGEGEMQNFLVTTAPLIGRLKIGVVEPK